MFTLIYFLKYVNSENMSDLFFLNREPNSANTILSTMGAF